MSLQNLALALHKITPYISTIKCDSNIVGDPLKLHTWAGRGFSQFGADGVIHKIFEDIGTTNKYYVEFGVQDASECNTRRLRETCKWNGLLMDGSHENYLINLKKYFITVENIAYLFKKNNVPKHFDLLSVDIDGNDYHILKKIIRSKYIPRVIIVETNFETRKRTTIRYKNDHVWDGTCYGSASVSAFKHLLEKFGYRHVASLRPDTYWINVNEHPKNYTVPDISTTTCDNHMPSDEIL